MIVLRQHNFCGECQCTENYVVVHVLGVHGVEDLNQGQCNGFARNSFNVAVQNNDSHSALVEDVVDPHKGSSTYTVERQLVSTEIDRHSQLPRIPAVASVIEEQRPSRNPFRSHPR